MQMLWGAHDCTHISSEITCTFAHIHDRNTHTHADNAHMRSSHFGLSPFYVRTKCCENRLRECVLACLRMCAQTCIYTYTSMCIYHTSSCILVFTRYTSLHKHNHKHRFGGGDCTHSHLGNAIPGNPGFNAIELLIINFDKFVDVFVDSLLSLPNW